MTPWEWQVNPYRGEFVLRVVGWRERRKRVRNKNPNAWQAPIANHHGPRNDCIAMEACDTSSAFQSRSRFLQPFLGRVKFLGVEIANLGQRERFADFRHPLLPGLLADQR